MVTEYDRGFECLQTSKRNAKVVTAKKAIIYWQIIWEVVTEYKRIGSRSWLACDPCFSNE